MLQPNRNEKGAEVPFYRSFSRVMVIFNPHAGKNTGISSFIKRIPGIPRHSLDILKSPEQYKERIRQYLEEYGIKAEISQSTSAGDALRIARQCSISGYDLVIAAGGDGTINAVINGLAGSETVFGAIPLGTVNVFAIQLNLPLDLRSACELIARGKIRRIDLGKAENQYFSCLAGIGFDAYVIATADSRMKKITGAGAYILNGLINLIRYRFHSIHLSIDSQPVKHSGYIVIIGNGRFYSNNLIISPQAEIDDGKLDVVIMKSRNIFQMIRYLWSLRKGNLTDLPDVEYYQGKEINIEKHGRHFIHLDGEYYGRTPVKITVKHSALKVVC
jgi:YegS/Rv2252/BmrU family lipid kinase